MDKVKNIMLIFSKQIKMIAYKLMFDLNWPTN